MSNKILVIGGELNGSHVEDQGPAFTTDRSTYYMYTLTMSGPANGHASVHVYVESNLHPIRALMLLQDAYLAI